ncbi:MAG: transposase [Cyanobacteria bacterium P01_F01_bin.150]
MLKQHGITEGVLATDDSDHGRSKTTKRIFKAHKLKDKKSGGYINGQTIVLLVLVSAKVTLPVGFEFYQADPAQRAWKKEDKRLQKQGIIKKKRPPAPAPNPDYPSKPQLALSMMEQFRLHHAQINVKAVVADALYGQARFIDAAAALFGGVQVISQLRHNQNIRYRNQTYHVSNYFSKFQGVPQSVRIRGHAPIEAIVGSARLKVCAHHKKRFVIALKYPAEKDYRYLVATDLTWRTIDIVQAYSLRWLVEVFIEDWKRGGSPPAKLTPEHLEILQTLVENDNDATLAQLAQRLIENLTQLEFVFQGKVGDRPQQRIKRNGDIDRCLHTDLLILV